MENKKMITKEMIDKYHYEMGEDFIDQNESIFNAQIMCGFLAGLRPELANDMWAALNRAGKFKSIQNAQEVYEEHFGEDFHDIFYNDFVTLINTTDYSRELCLFILTNGEFGKDPDREYKVIKITGENYKPTDFEQYVLDNKLSFEQVYKLAEQEEKDIIIKEYNRVIDSSIMDFLIDSVDLENTNFYTCNSKIFKKNEAYGK